MYAFKCKEPLKLFFTKSDSMNLSVAATIFAAFCALSTFIRYSIHVGAEKLKELAKAKIKIIRFFIFSPKNLDHYYNKVIIHWCL